MIDIKRAMQLAAERGQTLTQSPHDPALCAVQCRRCGYPGRSYDTLIHQYLKQPFGCVPCEWVKRNGRPWPFGEWWTAPAAETQMETTT